MNPILTKAPKFVHLKVHSAYSLLEGALPIAKLAKLAAANHFPAIGLTDTNNLFGALEFSEKLWGAGVQPIVGCTIDVDFGDNHEAQPSPLRVLSNEPRARPAGRIALFAMNADGFANLMRISKSLYFEPAADEGPHIKTSRL
jgi:DNA polymerase-3 subunit alpha